MHKSKVVLQEKSDIWTKFHPIVSIYVVATPSERRKSHSRWRNFGTMDNFSPRSFHLRAKINKQQTGPGNQGTSETLNMVLEHFRSYFRDSESTDCKLLLETVIANKLQLQQFGLMVCPWQWNIFVFMTLALKWKDLGEKWSIVPKFLYREWLFLLSEGVATTYIDTIAWNLDQISTFSIRTTLLLCIFV